jgi:hypothetical protein
MAKEPATKGDVEPRPDAQTEAAAEAELESKTEAHADSQAAAPTKADAQAKPTAQPAPKTVAARAGKPTRAVGSARPATGFAFEERPPVGGLGPWMHVFIRQTPSWLVSMVIHVVVLLLLALVSLPPPVVEEARRLVITPDKDQPLEEIEELDEQPLEEIEFEASDVVFDAPAVLETVDPSPFDDLTAARVSVDFSDIGLELAPTSDLANRVGTVLGNDLDGRGSGKDRLVKGGGGNEESERAVALALKWLVEHQLPDGGWSFDHTLCRGCRGQCRNPGRLSEARNAATGLALLPLLGAGQTHTTGKYKREVKAGLYFLVQRMQVSPQGGSLFENGGQMYSHGICAIALCEAYAMTHDKGLYAPAQAALNFIAYAQDPVGGGWRYQPRPPRGDTSVVGWQIMALKSGHMAYLRVPPATVQKASRFLDTVQANNGANYGYINPGSGQATTAIGLLCRMYLGWKQDNPALQRGADWIAMQGPSQTMYYNYYATQVMHHLGGERWKKWNAVMRDRLVDSQAHKGHEEGSWYFPQDQHAKRGGRLYCTAMATMVLEVYYRHLPIYRKQSTEEDFPLE